jgi:hypothetical protein
MSAAPARGDRANWMRGLAAANRELPLPPPTGPRPRESLTIARLASGGHPPGLTAMAYLTGSTSNAGCLGAMARIWSSFESGPVPSKKIPTSAFHLLR